ncbi:MAG: tRNA pseudouridine(38-40) synthase TruA [Paludibacteraceae bacterium]|nr:tRNA pseudouridine(38-40) synthase TruA [Paludibacteraceae bacterium]
MRYFIDFEYCGTAYHGWQIQPNAVSVQETLTKALQMVLRESFELVGAGRTDTGVHARQMVAHFDVNKEIASPQLLVRKLNGLLPADIAVHEVYRVTDDAHARFDATGRTYEYWLCQHKTAFAPHMITQTHLPLDYNKMNEAAKILLEETDFASFCKAHADCKTTICHVRRAFWEQRGECWVFTIEADRFLRNMVRATVGTLIEIGRGTMAIDELRTVLHDKNRCSAGQSMPADGLYLVKIDYPTTIFMPCEKN